MTLHNLFYPRGVAVVGSTAEGKIGYELIRQILRDISLRVAPLDRTEAEAMIREIRAFPILGGIRGQPPCDLDALAETLVNFSRLPFLYPEIAEVDLNPVFLLSKGLVVGDARVIRKEQRTL